MGDAFVLSRKLVFEPQKDCDWASEMILNPGLIADPRGKRIHMLFRSTGPYAGKGVPGKPPPYPIFLGYAWSDDNGESWTPDFSRPALAPRLACEIDDLYVTNTKGERVVDYGNGCVEDPRLFWLEGKCHVIVAARMFPVGAYWTHSDPLYCAPDWVKTSKNPFGKAAVQNVTSNLLYQVDLDKLASGEYEQAFRFVTHLTDPQRGENRDVLLFPERLMVNGRKQYVEIHRPVEPQLYENFGAPYPPLIAVCAAEKLEDLWCETKTQTILAAPLFGWERDRIGASGPLLQLSGREWLLGYHGKQDDKFGYSQSFMILERQENGLPRVTHRCPTPLLTVQEKWEEPERFTTPVVFVTGMLALEGKLLLAYGAADQKAGIATMDLEAVVNHTRRFSAEGRKIS